MQDFAKVAPLSFGDGSPTLLPDFLLSLPHGAEERVLTAAATARRRSDVVSEIKVMIT